MSEPKAPAKGASYVETKAGPTFQRGGSAFVKDRTGKLFEIAPGDANEAFASGEYLPAAAEDVAKHDVDKANSTLGAKAKTLAESAGAALIDTAQAPLVAPFRLGRAALGIEGEDPTQAISGRKVVESLAGIYGDLREPGKGDIPEGESGGTTGEAYARKYGDNARARAEANPGEALVGNVLGSLVPGAGLAGGAKALGTAAARGLGGGLAARAAGVGLAGAAEGAAYGSSAASEEAYLQDIPLAGEKVLASMGLGAIMGGAVSLGAEGIGALARRGSRGATPFDSPRLSSPELHAAEDAAVDAGEGAVTKHRFSDSLREFADERTQKALGARASDLKKMGRTAEQAQKEMRAVSRTVRGGTLEDGTKVFQPLQSQEELAERTMQFKNETGARLGKFREQADAVFESHPEIAPKADEIAARIRKEVVEPLANHPLSAARAQAAPIEQVAADLDRLGARAANDNAKGIGISDLTQLRMGLDDQIYQATRGVNLTQQGAPPNLKDLEKARMMIEEAIEASTDKAAQYFDKAQAQSYKQIKTQWRQLHLASEISGAASLQNIGNRVVSPSDYLTGIGAMASGMGAVGSLATTALHNAAREHASSVFAVLADRLANTLDKKVESGLAAYFKEAASRARVGSVLDKAVPLRRAITPTAVALFTRGSSDLSAAYQKRADEILAANREYGSGVRASVQTAMAGAYGSNPKLSAAVSVAASRGAAYLASQLPKGTRSPTVFSPSKRSTPSDLEIRQFAEKWAAVSNPLSVLDDLRKGTVSHAQIGAIKAVYPGLYAQLQTTTLDQIRKLDEAGHSLPFSDRLQLDLFLDLGGAGEPTLSGQFVDRVAALQAQRQAQQQQGPGGGGGNALAKLAQSAAPASDALSR